jgi:hypothetical protein
MDATRVEAWSLTLRKSVPRAERFQRYAIELVIGVREDQDKEPWSGCLTLRLTLPALLSDDYKALRGVTPVPWCGPLVLVPCGR